MSNNLIRKQAVKVGKMVNLPDDWKVKQIKETLDLESGVWDKENKEGYPVLRSTNFSESGYIDFEDVTYRDIPERKIEDKKLKKGDILLEISGGGPKQPVGRVVYFYADKKEEYLFGNFVKRLRLKNKFSKNNNPYYIFRFLERYYDIGQTETLQHQTTGIRNLDYRAYMSLPLPLPPLPEQKKIASILSSVDKTIEKTDEVIEKTKKLKKGLMQQLLTKGIGHSDFKEVRIGAKTFFIPKEWTVNSLSKLSDLQGGYAFKSKNYVQSGLKLLKIQNVQRKNINWEDVSYLPSKYLDKNEKYILSKDDIVIAMTRPIISSGLKVARIKENDILLNQRVGKFNIKNEVNSDFMYQYFLSKIFTDEIDKMLSTTNQPNISRKKILSINIIVPPLEEQKKIASILSSVDKKIKKEEEYKAKLERLKKGLMQKLLTGEIRVNTESEV